MAHVYLSIGSNIDKVANIRSCMARLQTDFPDCTFSNIYETPAFGFEGDTFYNLAAGFSTALSVEELEHYLKRLESDHQRKRHSKKFSSRTLDVDLLLYDQLILHPHKDLPRKEILKYNFVLFPLHEIAADAIHPELNKSIASIVQDTGLKPDNLKKVTLNQTR